MGKRKLEEEYSHENQNNIVNRSRNSNLSGRLNDTDINMNVRDLNFMENQTASSCFVSITQKSHCKVCNVSMKWKPPEKIDEWICPHCRMICLIKSKSSLSNITCSNENLLSIIKAWCNCEEIGTTAQKLDVELKTVMKIFAFAGLAAEKHMLQFTSQWKIGGPGIIVLIDTFPETFLGGKQQSRPILCLAELKGYPLTTLFQPIELEPIVDLPNTSERAKSKYHSFIQEFVHPESTVVARKNANFCSYEDILVNQPKFSVLASDDLLKHESVDRSLHTILSTIWEGAMYVCMNAQYYPHHLMKSYLLSHMWMHKFNEESLPLILKEIANMINS